ncbi:MAG: hypothetical protein AVDCRST_MAG30-1194 [uncultured Solirubrobacteraceae bacterium]|uniref:Uncharacterized protein n=1 Tax=uncultured Solirubrobacteraceae bacterium TaxID=1162706 RepID=A0A6J4S210_9ACTN|nr:MAG: hypothetical protein AVDCRST_MAG30-1194 [uncultured Solirubrobacteraceae bacterium]
MAADPPRRRLLATLLPAGSAGEARTAGARRVLSNVGLQFSGRIVGMIVSLVTVPLLARALGVNGFGVWTAALAFVSIFGSLTEGGLGAAATMRMSADPEHEGEWLGALGSLRTLVSIVVLILCLAVIPVVLEDSGDTRLVAAILSATVLFAGAASLMSVFQSRLRGAIPLALSILQSLLWLGTVVAVAAIGAGVVTVAAGYTAVMGVIALAQVLATRRLARLAWRGVRARWGALLRVAVPIGLAGVFITIYYKADAILLLRLGSEAEAGVYGAAYRILDPLLFLPQTVMAAIFPVMSAMRGAADDARLRRVVQLAADYMAALSLPILAVTVVLSGPIVALLFGTEFERSAEVLPILMIAFVAICYGSLAGYLAPVVGLQWRLTLFAGIGALANIGLNIVLIPEYGAVGSAWATVLTEGLTMLLLLVTCLRALGLRLSVTRILGAAVAAALMGLAMYAARPLGLIPGLAAGAVAYPALLLGLRVVRIAELREMIRR